MHWTPDLRWTGDLVVIHDGGLTEAGRDALAAAFDVIFGTVCTLAFEYVIEE